MGPAETPIGLLLARTARLVGRAFDEQLAAAGGSLPVWLVLLNLEINRTANQRELADAVGVTAPTLTHHLNAIEREGLIARRRDPANRRNHILEMTDRGEAAFARLRAAAVDFDQRLRAGFEADELSALRASLERLVSNAAPDERSAAWAGLIERSDTPTEVGDAD